jgi:hypothetical protein
VLRTFVYTLCTGPGSPAALAVATTRERAYKSPASSRTPRSAVRSASPRLMPTTLSWDREISGASSSPKADSIRHWMPASHPKVSSRSATLRTASADSVFGSRSPER